LIFFSFSVLVPRMQ